MCSGCMVGESQEGRDEKKASGALGNGAGRKAELESPCQELCLCLKSNGKPLEEVTSKQEDDLIRITFSQPSAWMQRGDWIRGHPEGSAETS